MAGAPDPKPAARVRDAKLMRELHLRPGSCPLCPVDPHRGVAYVSLHHLYDRDDVPANLQWLCGSGTTGHHGLITEEDEVARRLLGQHVVRRRPDFLIYLGAKAGAGKAQAWLLRRLFVVLDG